MEIEMSELDLGLTAGPMGHTPKPNFELRQNKLYVCILERKA